MKPNFRSVTLFFSCFLVLAALLLAVRPGLAFGITINKSSYTPSEPILTTSSGGPYVIYNVTTGEALGGRGGYDLGEDIYLGGNPGSYSVIEITVDGACEDAGYTYEECKTSAYFVGEALFTITAPSTGGGAVAVINHNPEISFILPSQKEKISKSVDIKYAASDRDDFKKKEQLGLKDNPVNLYFILGSDLTKRIILAADQPAVATYNWDVGSLPEGSVFIVVTVKDNAGLASEVLSPELTIDNSAPLFKVVASPAVSQGEDVELSVTPSEELTRPPEVTVTQRQASPVKVAMKASGHKFIGIYKVKKGFDGPARVAVRGEDLNGNTGTTITAGEYFSVGLEPPPKAVIISPLDQEIVASSPIMVKGGNVREDTELLLLVNGTTTYHTQPGKDGSFTFTNVAVSETFNKGRNFLAVRSLDQAGNFSEEVVNVKFNIAPELSIAEPKKGEVLSGTSTLRLVSSDRNRDDLKFTFELRRVGETEFTLLAKDEPGDAYVFDTTALPDGNYYLRATVNDGTTKVRATSSPFKIQNFLPTITFSGGDRQIINQTKVTLGGTIEAQKSETENNKPLILRAEYSLDDGKTWTAAPARDGDFNSSQEDFTVSLTGLKEAVYRVLVRAKDSGGRSGRATKTLIVDFGPPAAATITSPLPQTVIANTADQNENEAGVQFTITGRAEAGSAVTMESGGEMATGQADEQGAFQVSGATLKQHGPNEARVTVIDPAGNKSPIITLPLVYNNPAKIKFIRPRAGRGLGREAKIEWEVRDEDLDPVKEARLSYRRDAGGDFQTIAKGLAGTSYLWPVPDLPEGTYQLKLEVFDGTSWSTEVVPFTLDREAPTIDFPPLQQTSYTKAITFTAGGTATDNFSGIEAVEYSLDQETWYQALITEGFLTNRARFVVKHPTPLTDGVYPISVRAVDAAGNYSSVASQTVTVDTTPPRLGSLMLTQNKFILLPDALGDFSVTAGAPLVLRMSLEQDVKEATLTSDGKILSLVRESTTGLWETALTADAIGEVTLRLTATDVAGNSRETESIGRLRVAPSGRVVYRDKQGELVPVAEASLDILVFDFETQAFVRWQGEGFGVANPLRTDGGGRYQLLLPPGTYKIGVHKGGFERLKSSALKLLGNTPIQTDFILLPRSGLRGFLKDLID